MTHKLFEERVPSPSLSWPATAGHPGGLARTRQFATNITISEKPSRQLSDILTPREGAWVFDRTYYVYILASRRNGTLYIGVTNDLIRSVSEHKEGRAQSFTRKYGVKMLVHYEVFDDIEVAIRRETRLKKYKRAWKINLIQKNNIEWRDLYWELN
jgi:putative endonuclease